MKFRINYEYINGVPDSFIVEGDTIIEVRAKAHEGLLQRDGVNPWSEEL